MRGIGQVRVEPTNRWGRPVDGWLAEARPEKQHGALCHARTGERNDSYVPCRAGEAARDPLGREPRALR